MPAPDSTAIRPTQKALEEALPLADQILREIELGEVPLAKVALKASRLARLLNDFDIQKTMQFEASGYPCQSGIVPAQAWALAVAAGRGDEERDKDGNTKELVYVESIETLEAQARAAELVLSKITDTPKPQNAFFPMRQYSGESNRWHFRRQQPASQADELSFTTRLFADTMN
jgi:hypothetical protein